MSHLPLSTATCIDISASHLLSWYTQLPVAIFEHFLAVGNSVTDVVSLVQSTQSILLFLAVQTWLTC